MARHAWLALLLLWRWCETLTTSATSHDTLEKIGWAMTDGRRSRLRRRPMRTLRWATSLLELVAEAGNLLFVPAMG
jgi:hypothetical protein